MIHLLDLDLVKPTNPPTPQGAHTHTHVKTHPHLLMAENKKLKEVKHWISSSWVSKSSCATQLTLSMLCLDVPGNISSFYACRDEWLSAVNPSCKPHQRTRGERNRRGLSNKGIVTLHATLSGSGDCWGRLVLAEGWVSNWADKKRHPTWAEAPWLFKLRGYVPPHICEWSGFWMQPPK